VDLCTAVPTNGPLEVALRVWDHEGNVASALDARTIQIDHACPPPSSQLNRADTFDSTAVYLDWEAVNTGAGISSLELQWRTEPGSWDAANIISMSGDSRSTWFGGLAEGFYAFRMRALDENGQVEAWPADDASETSAILPATCLPDDFEPDDVITQTRTLKLNIWDQGNLCGTGNPDWFQVVISDTLDYFVSADSLEGGAAVSITVYPEDGQTILASGQAPGLGQSAFVRFQASAGIYYLKLEPLTPDLMGTNAVYRMRVSEVKEIFPANGGALSAAQKTH
jgi:hypothetical protein